LIHPIAENDLVRQAIELAAHTRRQIEAAGIHITDFEGIARRFRLTIAFIERPEGEDGAYLDDIRQIVISTKVKNEERINFTFLHELMHARIQDDPDLLSACHDVPGGFSDDLIEKLCNKGAAEMLMPSEVVRQHGCSVALIPALCEQFSASSLAVAFQMINCADDVRYLVIAELRTVVVAAAMPMVLEVIHGERLVVVYGAKSPAAKYPIRRNRHLRLGHGLYHAVERPGILLKMEADVPIGDNPWPLPCECLYFRQKVFAIFHDPSRNAISPDQMKMF
jgi:Zn-dependent peptidase ImmA (M78 family)